MSKALVIKNASFLTNKLTTVTFNDVYCTGVSFDESSIELGALGEATVGYTITPSNTTDEIIYTSSDETVVSFVDGTAIVNGIGSCTLGIQCGMYEASCEISVDIYEKPILLNTFVSTASNDGKPGMRFDSISGRGRLVCCDEFSKGYFEESIATRGTMLVTEALTAIKIPQNTNIIRLSAKRVYNGENVVRFTNADETFLNSGYTYVVCDSYCSLTYKYNDSGFSYISEDVSVPDGISGYMIQLRPSGTIATDFSDISTEENMETFVDTNMELSIHYLHVDSTETE